ncbi:hypothetical protein [Methylovorus mays]|uniref:hypothetical protein n=1 Tax=Methylovorus mays TaxID=184077 RepID=UPI001E45F487|nr:hypothetical protein [Methylovorus mays]MCB5205638.1 hypothetical protein [Methylovorus mays]
MKPENPCKRIVLAGNDGCRILFCEECNVAELEVGALSLRLDMQAFGTLAELLQEGAARLAIYNAVQERNNAMMNGVGNVH